MADLLVLNTLVQLQTHPPASYHFTVALCSRTTLQAGGSQPALLDSLLLLQFMVACANVI
jgi:hypothetical protein